jgi:hypothetical protein
MLDGNHARPRDVQIARAVADHEHFGRLLRQGASDGLTEKP